MRDKIAEELVCVKLSKVFHGRPILALMPFYFGKAFVTAGESE